MSQKRVRIYTCKKHPHWSLETSAPLMDASLKTFCPMCRDDFWLKAIGEADCRVEVRDLPKQAAE